VDGFSTSRRYAGMVDYLKILGDNVRAARKALNLSQEALALDSDIDRTYVSGIERGKRNPSLTMIAKLAERLHTTPAALLTSVGRGTGEREV
jgi:transcriptional regulator with XRE-family HTH domain